MGKIGIIGAMEEEVIALKRCMNITNTVKKAQMEFICGSFNNADIVVVRCGIGKVNAAVCTQILVDLFDVSCIINTGVAGGLHPDINIGDIVISTNTVHHDMDTTAFGDPRGFIPRMNKSFFDADSKLIQIAQESANSVIGKNKVYIGTIASGDQFVASIDVKTDIYNTFTAYCAEMEGAAIAHTCFLNNVAFVIIRAISDTADSNADVNFAEFTELAAKNALSIIEKMLENI
ncbi:MAG: 5'-methylthioadenosine/S-adenosylhomocysteine nucleosidase [Epulopiscium sp. Nuni2H_MBin003]|nr:MAG: 5'-methylthioadenosine/S-adenosylhomocysteine nucleosidase [Epulopiscium sp. Nuni2H_MBin003]